MGIHFAVLPSDIIQLVSAPQSTPFNQTTPEHVSTQTALRYLHLPHPRTGVQALFLTVKLPPDRRASPFSVEQMKILEVQAVNPPDERTWFLGDEVIADGKLLMMTPIDPAFLLLPILQVLQPPDGSLGNFRPADDMFEEAASKIEVSSRSLLGSSDSKQTETVSSGDILQFTSLNCARKALKHICDVKEITPEIVVYRFSPTILLHYLRSKVERLSSSHVLESSRTLTRGMAKEGLMEDGKESLLELAHTRAACDLVCQYLPSTFRAKLIALYDFRSLDEHLKQSFDETALSPPTANTIKNKSKNATESYDKKRKNTKGSQGVEKLKKANVNGMAKLSSFFKKSEATR